MPPTRTMWNALMLAGLILATVARTQASGPPPTSCPVPDSSSSSSSAGATIITPSPSARSPLLVSGGTVVNADVAFRADVYVEDGKIKMVRPNIKVPEGVPVIDATGKYVMPGGMDPHTHLAMPFMGTESCDDFFSGQAAALAGGTTFHIDYVLGGTPEEGGDLLKLLEQYHRKAGGNAVMDYGFHVAVTKWNDDVARDMEEVVKRGINSFKFFLAYKAALQVDDQQLLSGFTRCKQLGAIPQVHAENGDAVVWGQQRMIELGVTGPEGHPLSRPPEVEEEATGRAIRLASVVGVPLYVVHVMCEGAAREVAEARRRGQRVIGEPVVSGIALNDSHLWNQNFDHAARYVMSPPIRSAEHVTAVKAALATGALQLVATDHCPFTSSQKAAGRNDFRKIPNGVNGIEERMHITWDVMVNSGLMSPSDFVRVTSTECARIFNLYPQKGVIAEGSDADIIVFNPNATTVISAATHHSRIDTNVYEGWEMKGHVEVTISRGRVVWKDGQLNVTKGSGRFIPMRPFGYLFDGMEKRDAARVVGYRAPVKRE